MPDCFGIQRSREAACRIRFILPDEEPAIVEYPAQLRWTEVHDGDQALWAGVAEVTCSREEAEAVRHQESLPGECRAVVFLPDGRTGVCMPHTARYVEAADGKPAHLRVELGGTSDLLTGRKWRAG
jgi:hypothetical protein